MGVSEFEDGFEDGQVLRDREQLEALQLGEELLSAQIAALEPRAAVSVSEATSINDAIRLMLDNKIGAVLVVRNGHAVGIFTERDVLQRVAISGIDRSCSVAAVMTPHPDVLALEDSIAFALNLMIARGFRHIPIVDKAHRPVAVLSLREVVHYIVSLMPKRVLNLPPEPRLGIAKTPDGG